MTGLTRDVLAYCVWLVNYMVDNQLQKLGKKVMSSMTRSLPVENIIPQ